MSKFNLDRFRFGKKSDSKDDLGSKSPESEKENKPGEEQMLKSGYNSDLPDVLNMLLLAAFK